MIVVGAGFATIAEAGPRVDRAGQREVRQIQSVLKRVQRIEQVSVRQIERAPAATVRLLNLLVSRGASPAQLEAIALRGSHKVAIERRRMEDQIIKLTEGILRTTEIAMFDEDGVRIIMGIDNITEDIVGFLRIQQVSEDLILQVISARISAMNTAQDAALIAEAEIQAALAAAIDAVMAP